MPTAPTVPRVTLHCENPACGQAFDLPATEAKERKYCSRSCASSVNQGASRRKMAPIQFEVIAKLIQSKEPAKTAARLVLVEGRTSAAAAEQAGCSHASACNTVARFRKADELIRTAYAYRKGRKGA